MPRLKYIFMGSPPLAATILAALRRDLYPPGVVVTQSAKAAGRGNQLQPTAVEEYARAEGLECLPVENVNAPEVVAKLKAFAPDLVLVAAFGQILRKDILALPRLFSLNVHASLLPKYRGAAPVQWAIWNGDVHTGITIQKMAPRLDTGDILLQKTTPIGPEETSATLLDRLAILGGECLIEAVHLIEEGHHEFVPQDETQATYASKIERAHAELDWNRDADALHNQIRALQPWPVAETRLGKDRLKIFSVKVLDKGSGNPGDIHTDGKSWLSVTCGDFRALSLTEIQLENRKRLVIQDFLKAYRGQFPHLHMGNA